MRITRQMKIKKTEQLEKLAHEAGEVYSTVLVYFWRILRKKGIWLSQYGMQKLIQCGTLHSQTLQGIVDIFYQSVKSWRALRKTNPNAKLPRKRKWYFVVPYKESAIRVKDNKLILSNGIGNAPLEIYWPHSKPKYVEISYDDGYNIDVPMPIAPGVTAGIDLGEIHIAVANTGSKTIIVNGRELRSKKQYLNKETAKLQSKIDKCRKKSKRRKRLARAKHKMRERLKNQMKDILHKPMR